MSSNDKKIVSLFPQERDKEDAARLLMRAMSGGMGSFSNLVLHKDGMPLREENRELRTLRYKLHEKSVEIL